MNAQRRRLDPNREPLQKLTGAEFPLITRAPVCPECRASKHGNCDGTAFDEAADDIVECVCPPAFGHRERNPQR